MNNVLEVRHLCKSYNSLNGEIDVIQDVSFDVFENEFISIIGTSGCGKSTILNIIGGLDKDYTGSVNLRKDITTSYMLQDDALFPWLSVLDNACLGLKVQKKLSSKNISYVKYLLKKYGLEEFQNKKVNSLSGGMRQRVALIRTIATKPKLVLLDEPFSALDYQTRLTVSDDIYRILRSQQMSAILVTHDISEAISFCDRIIVLTKRPASVKKTFDIHLTLDKERTPFEARMAPEFKDYFNEIWGELNV